MERVKLFHEVYRQINIKSLFKGSEINTEAFKDAGEHTYIFEIATEDFCFTAFLKMNDNEFMIMIQKLMPFGSRIKSQMRYSISTVNFMVDAKTFITRDIQQMCIAIDKKVLEYNGFSELFDGVPLPAREKAVQKYYEDKNK